MRKHLRSIPLAMLLLGLFFPAAVHSAAAGQAPREGTVEVVIPAGPYSLHPTPAGDEVDMEGFGRLLVPGKPNLPARIFSIALPPGTAVSKVTFEAGDVTELPGSYAVPPVPLPRVAGEEDPRVEARRLQEYQANHDAVYGGNAPYPAVPGEVVCTGGYRRYNLVDVRITPVSYFPRSGKLRVSTNVLVRVHYAPSANTPRPSELAPMSARCETTARQILFNYDQAQSWYPQGPGSRGIYDYVIITLHNLAGSVQTLAGWEAAKGRNVKVVTTDWIASNYTGYDLAEKMRNFLRDKYPSGEWGIEDVCLVGDYDDVPMRRCWQDLGYGMPETDYYFAELSKPDNQSWDKDGDHKWGEDSDPIDFTAEVNVGRIPWSNSTTVENICYKSMSYEANGDPAFKKNILLLGAFFWPDTDNAVLMEYKTNPAHNQWMADWTATRMYEQGHSSYSMDYNLTWSNVKNVWSKGTYAFVNWAGHGSPYSSHIYYNGAPAFVDTSTCPYLNDDYPAIIFADACSNSDTDYNNIGKMMLKQGAVGFLGATKVALGAPGWNDPSDGSSQSLDYYFTTACTAGSLSQGGGHQWALRRMYINGLFSYTKYEMFEWGALWGQPDLRLNCDSSLWADTYTVPATGGAVNFTLHAGADYANRAYLLLGTLSGTVPGFDLPGGTHVPLNWDGFTNVLISLVGTPICANFMGNLDGTGAATATFDTQGAVPLPLLGLTANFAFILGPPPAYDFASTPVCVTFEP